MAIAATPEQASVEPKSWKKPKGKKQWQKELNSAELIGKGERNSVLISIAGHLRHTLKFDEALIDSTLQSINARRCRPQLTIEEVSTIARSEAKYENEPKTEEVKPAGCSMEEARQFVKLALYSSADEKKASGWDIPLDGKEAVNFATAFIYEHLKTLGKFYFADSTGYLLLKGQEDRLIQISSEDSYFARMLESYGIFAGQIEAIKVGKYINVRAEVDGTPATVHYSSHYNPQTKCFYFAEKAGWLIRGDGEKLERVPNGTDGELFAFKKQDGGEIPFEVDLDNLPTVKHSLVADNDSLMMKLLFKGLVFKPSSITTDEKMVLLTTYVVLLILMGVADDKPMIQTIGDSGTGKTHVLEKIGRAIVGADLKSSPCPAARRRLRT